MNSLVQSTSSLAFNRSRFDHYKALSDHSLEVETLGNGRAGHWRRSPSTSRSKSKTKKEAELLTNSQCCRRERARKRQAFLRTYKLSSPPNPASSGSCVTTSKKLRKLMVKTKSVVVSIIGHAKISSFRSSCKGHRSIFASSARRLGEIFC